VLRIHDILVWIRIRIRRSMPLTNGSGFVINLQDANNNKFFTKVVLLHLHNFQRLKVKKKSQNSRNQGFSYYLCLVIDGSGSGAGAGSGFIPLTNGS
jgi:hypothetical protein